MAGADISVIYEVRRHLSTCTVSCSRTFGTYSATGNRAQAGRLLRCHRQRHQTTCEPTEPGLMNGVLPFLFRLWKIIVAALRAPPGDLLSRCRPTTVPRSSSLSLSRSARDTILLASLPRIVYTVDTDSRATGARSGGAPSRGQLEPWRFLTWPCLVVAHASFFVHVYYALCSVSVQDLEESVDGLRIVFPNLFE